MHVETLPWAIRDGEITCCLCGKSATSFSHGSQGQHDRNVRLWCAFAKGGPPISLGSKGKLDNIGDNLNEKVLEVARTNPKLCLPPHELRRVLESPIKNKIDEISVRECCNDNYVIQEYAQKANFQLDRMAMAVQGVGLILRLT